MPETFYLFYLPSDILAHPFDLRIILFHGQQAIDFFVSEEKQHAWYATDVIVSEAWYVFVLVQLVPFELNLGEFAFELIELFLEAAARPAVPRGVQLNAWLAWYARQVRQRSRTG